LREGNHGMNVRMALGSIVLLLVAACSPQPTPTPEFVDDEEYRVYRDLLLANEIWQVPPGTENVVFFDHTFVRSDPERIKATFGGKAAVSEELVANFLEANSRSYPLEARFELGKPVTLVPEEAIKNLIQGVKYAVQCYETVRAVYPAPEYNGWYYLSRVGFDARMETALVYIEQTLCGGSGDFLVLEKQSGVWKIIGWEMGIRSDMLLDSPVATGTPSPANTPLTASQPTSDLGAALTVTPTFQSLPAGSSARVELAMVPSCPTHPTAFGVDQLPAGWTAEFLASAIPCNRILVLTTAETAQPGRYSIRVTTTSETDLPTWAELTLEVVPCVELQPGEFTQAMGSNLVTLVTAGKPAIEHGLLIPLQVCNGRPGRHLLVTLEEVTSKAGPRMTSPPRFYLYRSRVWPEPNGIVAHGVPGTINVELPRIENQGWQLEASVTTGLYLLVFERDYYGSSPDPQAIPASLTYRLEILPQEGGGKTPTPPLSTHPGWTSYTNGNFVKDLAFDASGALWAVGSGGAVRWDLERGTYTKYTVDQGLASNDVTAVAAAPDGAIWFGTHGSGASRFDGQAWATYAQADGLPFDKVRSVAVAPDGAVWFSTYGASRFEGGVSRFDGQAWTTYTLADGLAGNAVWSITFTSDGAAWFGTGFGASRFDGTTWSTYSQDDGLPDHYVPDMAVAPDGALWLGTGRGLARFDGTTWTAYTEADGLALGSVLSVAVASDGALWCGTYVGVSRFDGTTWTICTEADGLAAGPVQAVAASPGGLVCLGTDGGGVSCFDGDAWTAYTTADGLAGNGVSAIAVARDGAVWFGTSGHGVSRFDGAVWTTYTTADGLAYDMVTGIAFAPDGAIWFATYLGASRFDGATWTTYIPPADGPGSDQVQAVAFAPDGAVWLGTQGGAFRFDGKNWTAHRTAGGQTDVYLSSFAIAPDGVIWFGTSRGAARLDGSAWTTYTFDERYSEIWLDPVALTPDGTVWFRLGQGVTRFDGTTWTTYPAADVLAGSPVSDAAVVPDGAIWFATYGGGVSRFDGRAWTTYTTADGLANNFVRAVAAAPDGALWFGTEGGASRYLPLDGE